MSIKTRLEKLEQALTKNAPAEALTQVTEIVVRSRAEVEQLQASGLMDSQDSGRQIHHGPVRIEVAKTVKADEFLKTSSGTRGV